MADGKDKGGTQTCRTNPIPHTITPVPRYPKKLVIYMSKASPYWWVRYYADGKVSRKSTKSTDKRQAFEFAKRFYDELNLKRSLGTGSGDRVTPNFVGCADKMISAQELRMKRGEISKISHENDILRLNKHLKPSLGHLNVSAIGYKEVEELILKLSAENLSPSTINYYLGLLKKVLGYSQRLGYLKSIPQLPKVRKKDSPRGWFNLNEYKRLYTNARHLANKVFIVKNTKEDGVINKGEGSTYITRVDRRDLRGGRPIRKITISPELRNIISFMVNSFIRPTDLKNMQHKHVEVVNDEKRKTLVLKLPKSKEHDQPIWTMPKAVDVYLRQLTETLPKSSEVLRLPASERAKRLQDQYVFLPNETNRDKALKTLQIQFNVLLNETGLKYGTLGEDRTLYSLRHTCIMYRLMYGMGIDLVTLANNARTSPEMIHRFYARHLTGEHNLDMLQSRRKRNRDQNILSA